VFNYSVPRKTSGMAFSLSNTSLCPLSPPSPHKPAGKKETIVECHTHTFGGGRNTRSKSATCQATCDFAHACNVHTDYSMSTYVIDLSEVSRWEDGHQKQSREVDEQRCATSSKRHVVCQSGLMVRRVDQCIRSSPWIVLGERSAHHLFGGGGGSGPIPSLMECVSPVWFSLSCSPPLPISRPRLL